MGFTQTANKSIASIIQNLADQANLQIHVQNENYVQCGIGLPENRKQLVHLMSVGEIGDKQVIQIWTPVAQLPTPELPSDVANVLLVENGNFKCGAFAIRKIEDAHLLVFFQNILLESLSPQDFAITIGIVAQTGDQWESKLGTTDQF